MKAHDFSSWMEQLNTLSRKQLEYLRSMLSRQANNEEAIKIIEQNLQDKPLCPHCTRKLCGGGRASVGACKINLYLRLI